jgi:hypothetical protein
MTPVVTLDVHGVAGTGVVRALWRMASHRQALARTPGLRFWRLLGTGEGRRFTSADADPHHWALFAVWDSEDHRRAYEEGRLAASWRSIAHEHWQAELRPLDWHGSWGGRDPFEGIARGGRPEAGRPVAALTRARVRPAAWSAFQRSVPAVAADTVRAPGLRLAIGIGEAPIGLQATFSLWDDERSLRAFAYGTQAHAAVVERTRSDRWYAEELFARFALTAAHGTLDGVAWGAA